MKVLHNFFSSRTTNDETSRLSNRPYMPQQSNDTNRIITTWLNSQATNTQRQYKSILGQWLDYLGPTKILAAKEFHARGFLNECSKARSNGLKVTRATVDRKGVILKSLYDALLRDELLKANPFAKLDFDTRPDGTRRPHRALEPEEVQLMLDAPGKSHPCDIRDGCFISLVFALGLRISEALALTLEDIDVSQPETILVRLRATKNGRSYVLPLPDWAHPRVKQCLDRRLSEGAVATDPLLSSYSGLIPKGIAIPQESMRRAWKTWARCCGLGHLTVHSARATAITQLLKQNMNHGEVKEFSRHASVQMVETYDKRRYNQQNHPAKKIRYA